MLLKPVPPLVRANRTALPPASRHRGSLPSRTPPLRVRPSASSASARHPLGTCSACPKTHALTRPVNSNAFTLSAQKDCIACRAPMALCARRVRTRASCGHHEQPTRASPPRARRAGAGSQPRCRPRHIAAVSSADQRPVCRSTRRAQHPRALASCLCLSPQQHSAHPLQHKIDLERPSPPPACPPVGG